MDTISGDMVKRIRKKLGKTGDELGRDLGVTGNTVYRWECGARACRGVAAVKMKELGADKRKAKS